MTDYFVDFDPADAVQFPQEVADWCQAFQWSKIQEWFDANWSDSTSRDKVSDMRDGRFQIWLCRNWSPGNFDNETHINFFATPGQWLVRQGSRVWVQDEEPARVTATWPEPDGSTFVRLSNRWSGPVEGGAE